MDIIFHLNLGFSLLDNQVMMVWCRRVSFDPVLLCCAAESESAVHDGRTGMKEESQTKTCTHTDAHTKGPPVIKVPSFTGAYDHRQWDGDERHVQVLVLPPSTAAADWNTSHHRDKCVITSQIIWWNSKQ